jgi:hypothetical protein
MINIPRSQYKQVGLEHALGLLEPFSGVAIGSGDPIPSRLGPAVTAEQILELFYTSGPFRGLRSVLLSPNGKQSEDGRYTRSFLLGDRPYSAWYSQENDVVAGRSEGANRESYEVELSPEALKYKEGGVLVVPETAGQIEVAKLSVQRLIGDVATDVALHLSGY